MDREKIRKEMDDYLASIGGLKSCYITDRIIDNSYFFGTDVGWFPLIKKLIEDLIKLGWDKQVCQVKEKFGGLRFYIGGANDKIFERIGKAEEDSYEICERCGEPGEPNKEGWIKTLCPSCKEKRIA